MTDAEFEALAALMRLHDSSASRKALRAVLVDGASISAAAAANLIQESHVKTVLESAGRVVARAQVLNGVVVPAAV